MSAPTSAATRVAVGVAVDRIACRGDGLCAGLLPEAVTLDDWGYPIVGPLPPGSEKAAKRAVAACPALALRLEAR